MKPLGKALCAAFILTLTGCATRTDLVNLQRDVDEVKSRLLQMDREMSGVKTSAKQDIEKTLTPYQKDMDQLRRGTADIQASIDSVKVDSQVLAGKLDEITLLAKKPADDIALLREDMERRMAALEERLTKMEKGLGDVQKGMAEAKAKEPELTPEALYQKALDTFRAGDSAKARDMLSRFIEANPKHELVANAHYWLGETYYAEKKYDQAILEFQEIIKNFPKKEKVPAAMLKQAMAFRELGDMKSARYVLKKLQEDYPLSDEAQKAKERLKEMK